MVTTSKTRTKRNRSRSQKFKKAVLGRPQGVIQKRVQAVGPEKSGIVAVEMTGTYHKPPMRTFRDAGYETRLVHPFASSFYRQPEHGDDKTDDNDLDANFRAAVNGFGLLEKPVDPIHQQLQILSRRIVSFSLPKR